MLKSAISPAGGDGSVLPSWVHRREPDDDGPPSVKEEGGKEPPAPLLESRPSVRDLASKFEVQVQASALEFERTHSKRGAAEAVKGNDADTKGNDAYPQLLEDEEEEGDDQFKKLRRCLNDIRGRVEGRYKGQVEEALNSTENLSVLYQQRESELEAERSEVTILSLLLKQAAIELNSKVEEAREEAREEAQAELEAVKAAAANNEIGLQEQEQTWTTIEKKELEELKREANEARRIKMLHEASRTIERERQLERLRHLVEERTAEAAKLRKEVEMLKRPVREAEKDQWYRLTGGEHLGTILSIGPVDYKMSDLALCSFQWYQVSSDGSAKDIIPGAVRAQYAPEPVDVDRFLRAEIHLPSGKTEAVQTAIPIDPLPGLEEHVQALVNRGCAMFNVRIVLKNGELTEKQSVHTFDVNKSRVKLRKGRTVKADHLYSASMQICGARGGGDSAAQGLFWVAKKGVTYMLVLESERERNAAILVTRRLAELNKICLGRPDDAMALGS